MGNDKDKEESIFKVCIDGKWMEINQMNLYQEIGVKELFLSKKMVVMNQ